MRFIRRTIESDRRTHRSIFRSSPGEQNQFADSLSRHKPPLGEWRLYPGVVHSMGSIRQGKGGSLFLGDVSPLPPLVLPHWGPPIAASGSDLASRPQPASTLGLAVAGPERSRSGCTEPVRRTILNAIYPSTGRMYCRWRLFSRGSQ